MKGKRKQGVEKGCPAYARFGLSADPFSTLALRDHELESFSGRRELVERLRADLASCSNTGLAGEPGMGKSSLLNLLKARAPRGVQVVSLGVALDDAVYFLTELLGALMEALPRAGGFDRAKTARHLREGALDKAALVRLVRLLFARSKRPVVVLVDDVEKIRGDRVRHLTRSDRTLQFLEELRPVLEARNACFFVTLQEEFYAKVTQVLKEGAEPTVLGLFRNVVKVDRFAPAELRELLRVRLKAAGFVRDPESLMEPEGLRLALALSEGNPRRFLYLLSEGMARAALRGASRIGFEDVFGALNEHLKLDRVCMKLLFFLSKSGRATADNADLQAFMGLDNVSLSRRFEVLAKARLASVVDVVDGARVYALPGTEPSGLDGSRTGTPSAAVGVSQKGERMFLLDDTV